jgi:oligopeptide/dipeptide ABC transporter, ATP-binding protein, C-terminal domain
MKKILTVKDLEVSFDTYAGEVKAVRGVSFDIDEGEVLAIVGESGCGKSVTAQTIMKLNPMPPARIKNGTINLDGIDIVGSSMKEMEKIRGSLVSMIFQDPMTSLNPTMTVGRQISETLIKHQNMGSEEAFKKSIEMLELVQIPNAAKRAKQYPHEFSGGMRQRAMIALALACSPKLLIADEPTTALDVTIQAQIIDLMKDIQQKTNTSIILITHDLGVVADIAQKVIVMYAGKVVERGTLDEIFSNPSHPYTWGLMGSVPRIDLDKEKDLTPIEGTPPDLFAPPVGCGFADRCKYCMKICKEKQPEFFEADDGHKSACWLLHPDAPKAGRFAEKEVGAIGK